MTSLSAANSPPRVHEELSPAEARTQKASRPPLTHHNTTPDLFAVAHDSSNDDGDKIENSKGTRPRSGYFSSSGSESSDDLLVQLEARQSDQYRNIKFLIPKAGLHEPFTKKNYEKRVSFDTINIQYSDDFDNDFDDYEDSDLDPYSGNYKGYNSNINEYNFNNASRGRRLDRSITRSPSPNQFGRNPLESPSTSPNRRMLSPMRYNPTDVSRFLNPYRTDYPTRPIITHRGCTFTKFHKKFEDLYLHKLYNEENNWLKPILPLRVILVYISGRKHTWVALDWILRNFIEHGDSIIVVLAINHDLSSRRRYSNYQSPQKIVAKTPKMRSRQRNRPEYIKFIAKNIMTYIMEVINKDIIAKVSVEIAEGNLKSVLKEMYKLYEPSLVCTGTKPNMRISAPLKSWLSSKLTDRLVKNFPLPVIVVPAMNMANFEVNLQNEINSRYVGKTGVGLSNESSIVSTNSEFSSSDANHEKDQIDDSSSINSDESVGSDSSANSYSSYDEISKLYKNYQNNLHEQLTACKKEVIDENYFSNFVKVISDKSSTFCDEVRSVDPDFRGKGSKLARAITGSNSFGTVPYKTKSLLQPLEHAKSTLSAALSTPGLSYKDLKRNLKLKQQQQQQQQQPPTINIEQHSPIEPPRKSALKFVDLQSPSKDSISIGNNNNSKVENLSKTDSSSSLSSKDLKKQAKEEKKLLKKNKSLKKSLSHDIDSKQSRPVLEPLKSHPDITMLSKQSSDNEDSSSDKKKHKKKGRNKFWSLFKV